LPVVLIRLVVGGNHHPVPNKASANWNTTMQHLLIVLHLFRRIKKCSILDRIYANFEPPGSGPE